MPAAWTQAGRKTTDTFLRRPQGPASSHEAGSSHHDGPSCARAVFRAGRRLAPYAAAIATILFLHTHLSAGHQFNEDYAVYLQQASNIAHNRPIHDMGIIRWPDPTLPLIVQSPLTYPPLLPAIYALPVRLFGFNLELFKLLQLGLLLSGLLLFCGIMRRWKFSDLEITTSLLLFGFSFEIRRSVNSIGSDLPFIFFLMPALWALDRFSRAQTVRQISIWGLLAGTALLLAIDLRTVAIALLPALACADFIRHKKIRIGLAVPFSAFAILWLAQRVVVGQSEAYGYIWNYPFFTVWENIRQFYWAVATPLSKTVPQPILPLALTAVSLFALVGMSQALTTGLVLVLFTIFYAGLLLILPDFNAGARYLVPLLLPLGAFACRGAADIFGRFTKRKTMAIAASALASAGAVLLFSLAPRPLPAGRMDFGVKTDTAQQAFGFLQQNTPPKAVLASSRTRSFHLFTDRQTIRTPYAGEPRAFGEWRRRYDVDFAVIKTSAAKRVFDFSDCPGSPLCSAQGQSALGATRIYENRDYAVFKFAKAAR